MDRSVEEKIINVFFNKKSRERILYELKSAEKRNRFFDRISHRCEDYINCRLIVYKSDKLVDADYLKEILCGKNRTCYVMAYKSRFDGKFVDFDEAMNELWGNGPFLVYSINNDSLYLEAEYDFDIHPSYILSNKTIGWFLIFAFQLII